MGYKFSFKKIVNSREATDILKEVSDSAGLELLMSPALAFGQHDDLYESLNHCPYTGGFENKEHSLRIDFELPMSNRKTKKDPYEPKFFYLWLRKVTVLPPENESDILERFDNAGEYYNKLYLALSSQLTEK